MPFSTPVWHWFKRVLSFRTLRSKFILGFVIASMLSIGNVLIVQSLLRQSDTIAATINIAGKMRMLSQRIGLMQLAMHDLKITGDQDTDFSFHEQETNFERALQALRHGGQVFELTIPAVTVDLQTQLDKIETAWRSYLRVLATMRSDDPDPYRLSRALPGLGIAIEMMATSEWLLNNTEALIDNLIDHTQTMQNHVMHKVYGLFFINVLMLLLAWAIISRKVLKPIKHLMHISDGLAAGNYSVRLRLDSDDEFGALSRVLNKSSAHIEHLLQDLEAKQATLKQAEVKLRRAALVYQHISDGIVITDADGHVQDINPAFSAITGYTADEMIGNRMNKLSAGRHMPDFFRALWSKLQKTGSWSGDIWNKHKWGKEFVSHLMISSCFNDDGSVNCRIGLFSDVTEKRRQEALIWRQAHFDHLTQLPNRQMFQESLKASMEQSQRSGRPFALIFLDLDLFKEINDTFGHDEGDVLLQQVAQRISKCCRCSDQVARLGGDEFIMIIQDLERLEDAYPICGKVLESVSQPYRLTVSEVRISCSIGVAFYPNDTDNATELLKYADIAMYAAKEKGRNQYCLFSSTMHDSVRQRHGLLRDLQLALDNRQIILHYQPIIHLQSGRVAKAEALVRWQHPEHGLVSPADFIPLAEDSGMIVPLGESIFHQAAKQASLWRKRFKENLVVSINVSPAQFQSEGLSSKSWINALRALGLPGSAITIEITERLLMEHQENVYEKLQEFRRAGIQIALDDFGTGYSSLSYLKRFNIDTLKIDQSFVHDLAENPENMALCKAIITMSHQLGIKVVAEGIECEQQHDLLLAAGCDYGQGYFYSKPISAERFTDWLAKHDSREDAAAATDGVLPADRYS